MKIPYRIQAIKTAQFAIFPDKMNLGKNVDIGTQFQFGVSKELNNVRCISTIKYSQGDNLLMVLELHCFFDVAPDGVDQLKKEKKLPVDFLRYIATIVVGTARGVIHARTESTVLNQIVLPPINLVDIIKNDFEFGK